MKNRALDTVKPWFGLVFQTRVFDVVETQDSASFGDSFAVAESDAFRLRFLIDRDQIFIDISALKRPDTWHDLSLVKNLIEGTSIDSTADIPELAAFLEQNFAEIEKIFKGENLDATETALKELKRERAEQMFPPAFKNPPPTP